jgi:hypothetical protein
MHDTTALSDQRNATVWAPGRLLLGAFFGVSTGISSQPIAATYGWSRGEASLGPLVGILVGGLASRSSAASWIVLVPQSCRSSA